MASSSPMHISVGTSDHSKTGLVSSGGVSKSYGTVKESSGLVPAQKKFSITHIVEDDDTLQGIALKYDVSIQQIQRMNNLWNTDSLHIRTSLKIPVAHSNESSRSQSPTGIDNPHENSRKKTLSANYMYEDSTAEEEVKSKLSNRRRIESEPVSSDGVKSIADILNSADQQLKLSRQFAEKLAQRCADRALPEGAYNRTVDMKNHLPDRNRHSRSPSPRGPPLNISPGYFPSRRQPAEQRPEKESETREKVADQIFEL